jgi:hypothetical protein
LASDLISGTWGECPPYFQKENPILDPADADRGLGDALTYWLNVPARRRDST